MIFTRKCISSDHTLPACHACTFLLKKIQLISTCIPSSLKQISTNLHMFVKISIANLLMEPVYLFHFKFSDILKHDAIWTQRALWAISCYTFYCHAMLSHVRTGWEQRECCVFHQRCSIIAPLEEHVHCKSFWLTGIKKIEPVTETQKLTATFSFISVLYSQNMLGVAFRICQSVQNCFKIQLQK